ncbi:hypothetical protein CR513_41911, partial [Mucuna pruriens]
MKHVVKEERVDLIKTFKTLWSYIIILLFLCLYTKLLKLNPNLRGLEKNPTLPITPTRREKECSLKRPHRKGKSSLCPYIDGGSNVNLRFPIIPHPKPYKLQWLNTKGNMLVLVELTLGKYKDEILCDVVPMEETRILLGRP